MKRLNKKGQGAGLITGTITIVTVVILLFISILLVTQVRNSFSRTYNDSTGNLTGVWDASDNDTFDTVADNSNTAFVLLAISLIVLVAFMIISILRGGL